MEDTITILYNNSYGGFAISNKALELYNNRKKEIKLDVTQANDYDFFWGCNRHDQILVNIFNELGDEFGKSYSKIKSYTIPKIYEKYYDITDYDGLEKVIVNIEKYKLDKINEILNGTKEYNEKIEEIQNIIKINNIMIFS